MENHFSIAGLEDILQRLNLCRHSPSDTDRVDCTSELEEVIEALFCPSQRLAVYGSLAPGKSFHHILEDVKGHWLTGYVTGQLFDRGWGSAEGYPGIVWEPGGAKINVHLLVSAVLPDHWPRLDQFEGDEYRRILTPVFNQDDLLCVANIYELRV